MGEPYNPDEAKAAKEEAVRFARDHPDSPEIVESWGYAAELFERGAGADAFAASQAIHCFRKAGKTDDALRVGATAVSEFPHDNWVRGNTSWAEYDRAKAAGTAGDVDTVLDALGRMLDLIGPMDDPGMQAEQIYWRLWHLIPRPQRDGYGGGADEPEVTDSRVLDFLAGHFEQLFQISPNIRRERDGEQMPSPKESLARLARREFTKAPPRWEDVDFTMSFATEAFPTIPDFAAARVTALLELGRAAEAIQVGETAIDDFPDEDLIRLVARAMCVENRHSDAASTLLAGCYQFRSVWQWRDLAGVRWTIGDIAGSNRCLAIALRLLERERDEMRADLAARFHGGRAAGALKLDDANLAALEAVAAERALTGSPDDGGPLSKVLESLKASHADLLEEARAMPADELDGQLKDIRQEEREEELEIGLRPARVSHVDDGRGFGYAVLTDGAAGDPAEGEKVYFSFKAVEGSSDGMAEGSTVRVLLARALDRRDPAVTAIKAVLVRPD